MTMLAEPSVDVAAEDRQDRAWASQSLITVSEEKRCPRCQSMIPPECVAATFKNGRESSESPVRTVLIYCPPCRAGFEAEFETRGGFPVQVSPTRVLLASPGLDELKRARAAVRGDVFVERLALTMEAEHELEQAKEQEAARRAFARSIRRTEVSLERLRKTYALRYPDRPYTPEEAAGIDQGDADCDLATSRFDQFRQLQDHSPYVPDAPAPAPALGGVPAPERTVDPSTSQVSEEDRLDWQENHHEDPERFEPL